MKIPYKKSHLRLPLIFGIIWLVFSLLGYFFADTTLWIALGWLVLSIMYFTRYLYLNHYGYISLSKEALKIQGWKKKSIRFSDIVTIKQFAGEYIIKTETKEIRIDPRIVNPEYLDVLQEALRLDK